MQLIMPLGMILVKPALLWGTQIRLFSHTEQPNQVNFNGPKMIVGTIGTEHELQSS